MAIVYSYPKVAPALDDLVVGSLMGKDGHPTKSFSIRDIIKLVDVSAVTLQQVLDNNHELVDGNNFQGTDAGIGNTGSFVNAFGYETAINNGGKAVNALGTNAAGSNSGDAVNAFGDNAALNNTGFRVNAIGLEAALNNEGSDVNAFGYGAAGSNTGYNVNAFGNSAGSANGISGATIFSNDTMPSYLDYAAASTAITVPNGGSANCTYLYHDQTTNSIGAVRL